MRTFVLLLILYANTVAPWWCCCSVARAKESWTSATPAKSAKPICTASCCQTGTTQPADDSHPRPLKHQPCPIQEQLLLDRPSASLERIDLELKCYFDELTQLASKALAIPDQRSFAGMPAVGAEPTLLMSELRLKYHHAFLC